MKLYLIRHGQTAWNHAQRFQGHIDTPLNEVGRQQAKALARRLSNQSFDMIYSSDMLRATETASMICGLNFQSDVRLRELKFGDWEGLTYSEIKEKDPGTLQAWKDNFYDNAPPNGETLSDLARRTRSFLDDLLKCHKDKTIMVVAHGGVLQVLICLALNIPPMMYWQFHLSPASLSETSFYPEGAILNLLNDTSHLGDAP